MTLTDTLLTLLDILEVWLGVALLFFTFCWPAR
jgi:hypothetical protein